jgi:hypothetical protein
MSEKRKLEPLIKLLIDWMNQELADKRVIIKDLQEDLYDGQIIQLLFGNYILFKIFLNYFNLFKKKIQQKNCPVLN